MANAVKQALMVRCASGRVAEFIKDDGTSGSTFELVTGGNDVNQTAGVSFGDALSGEVVTHAFVASMGLVAEAPAFGGCYILSETGQVAMIIQGAGGAVGPGLQPLCKPLAVRVGFTAQAIAENAGTGIVRVFVAAAFSDGSYDVYGGTLSDASSVALTSLITGASWGQSAAGKTAMKYYAIFNNTNTINEDGNGNDYLYAQSAQGQLTGAMYPILCASGGGWSKFTECPIPVAQNDTLKGTYAT